METVEPLLTNDFTLFVSPAKGGGKEINMALVYLYELDSVRKSNQELVIGQQVLFEEIVIRGNRVVLSFNQFTDSNAFLCAFKDEAARRVMIELIKNGNITFATFYTAKGEVSSPLEYVLGALEKAIDKENSEKGYIFSALPIDKDDKQLLKKVYAAIQHRDLKEIEKLIKNKQEMLSGSNLWNEKINNELDILKSIKIYVSLLLEITEKPIACVQGLQRSLDLNGKEPYLFSMYMDKILEDLTWKRSFADINFTENEFEKVMVLLNKVKSDIQIKESIASKSLLDNRSEWIEEIRKCKDKITQKLAKIIVNLCYNYTIEMGIRGVVKHASDMDIISVVTRRLIDEWKICSTPYTREESINLPDWKAGKRIIDMTEALVSSWKCWDFAVGDMTYEEIRKKSHLKMIIRFIVSVAHRFFMNCRKVLAGIVVLATFNFIEEVLQKNLFTDNTFCEIFLLWVIMECIDYMAEKSTGEDYPNIVENMLDVPRLFFDIGVIVCAPKNIAYFDNSILKKKRFYEKGRKRVDTI